VRSKMFVDFGNRCNYNTPKTKHMELLEFAHIWPWCIKIASSPSSPPDAPLVFNPLNAALCLICRKYKCGFFIPCLAH